MNFENRIIKALGITTDGKERLLYCRCGEQNYFSNGSCWSCKGDLTETRAVLNFLTKGFAVF